MSEAKKFTQKRITKRPGVYVESDGKKIALKKEYRQALVGLTFTPVGQERQALKLPTSANSTLPFKTAGWYHLPIAAIMNHLETVDLEAYRVWRALIANCPSDGFALVSPDFCEDVV